MLRLNDTAVDAARRRPASVALITLKWFVIALSLFSPALVSAQAPPPVSGAAFQALLAGKNPDLKNALMQALASPSGKYEGELTGDFASFMKSSTNSRVPVMVSIHTLNGFREAGCRRMSARVSQAQPFTDKAGQHHAVQQGVFTAALCPDGRPPQDLNDERPFVPR